MTGRVLPGLSKGDAIDGINKGQEKLERGMKWSSYCGCFNNQGPMREENDPGNAREVFTFNRRENPFPNPPGRTEVSNPRTNKSKYKKREGLSMEGGGQTEISTFSTLNSR